jgi:thioredoxin-related protein
MTQLLIAVAVVVVAGGVAVIARGRMRTQAPTQPSFEVPSQLDRADFDAPESPWLVVVFTSATCDACALVSAKAQALQSPEVAVQLVAYPNEKALHDRYRIQAVPSLVLADRDGVVRYHVIGPVTATDLWAGVATAREAPSPT